MNINFNSKQCNYFRENLKFFAYYKVHNNIYVNIKLLLFSLLVI